ncbi:MAG TPA: hypothetical protein DIT29_02695 [Pseudothermotoga sp.]|nr:hypothetical protein [Pseudothermotoga sp.]HCO97618.1 hypothetical protein [Pseudothermotoga sp.]
MKAGADMKLVCLGGFGEQGRSSLYVEGRSRFLVDYGIKKVEHEGTLGELPLNHSIEPEFVLLTHAHQDHSAMLPLLVEKGFRVPVYCTLPTKELTIQLCRNWYETYRSKNLEPPYKLESVEELEKLLIPVPYNETFQPSSGTRVTFYPSGHLVGSAIVYIEDELTIAHFGDTNFGDRFNPDPFLDLEAEVGIINGSYGGAVMNSQQLRKNFLATVQSSQRTVLIPCASIGRGQEICAVLIEQETLNKPIYVAKSVLENTKKLLDFKEFLRFGAVDTLNRLLKSPRIKVIEEAHLHDLIAQGSILIGPDAMLSSQIALKIFDVIKNCAQDLVILNGYQAPGTLGRRLLDGELKGIKVRVVYSELKIHTDLEDNERIIERCLSKARLILIHHGEEPKATNLAKALKRKFPNLDIRAPHTGDEIHI